MRLLNAVHAGQCSASRSRAYASSASNERQYCTMTFGAKMCPRNPLSGRAFSSLSMRGIARKTGSHL